MSGVKLHAGKRVLAAQRRARRQGSALIMVMGVLVLLSIVGTAFVLLMKIEMRAARNYSEDIQAQFLAKQALAYCLEHPTFRGPTSGAADVDSDGIGGADSRFFTYPLTDLTSDVSARYALLVKPFDGRLNVNWNGFHHAIVTIPPTLPPDPDYGRQALNEGSSLAEVSLEKAIAAHLNGICAYYGGDTANSMDIAKEIAGRIVNYRYGGQLPEPPSPPLPITPPYRVFHGLPAAGVAASGVTNYPGNDGPPPAGDDTQFLDDTMLAFEPPLPPAMRDAHDLLAWIGAAVLPSSLNWRPDPAADIMDENGDGLYDETDEQINEPQEFLQSFPAGWLGNNDTPFGASDLQSIIDPTKGSALKEIINDVLGIWVPAQGYAGYGMPPAPTAALAPDYYFPLMAPLFTTYSNDLVGGQTPINHLNLLANTPAELAAVAPDRSRFIAAMKRALMPDMLGDVGEQAADNTAWQVLANFIDYLDDDGFIDAPANTIPANLLTVLVKKEGWVDDPAHDLNGNHTADPGEPGTRTFHGTERQPFMNEFWIYNRRNDRFDNDLDGTPDDANPVTDPLPLELEPPSGRNGYYIELTNHYATDICVYYDPNDATKPKMDWAIRVSSGGAQLRRLSLSASKRWDPAALPPQWVARVPGVAADTVTVPAGGYLVIESRDYSADNVPAGSTPIPSPAMISKLVNFDYDPTQELFAPGDTVELIYSYTHDPDGAGPLPPVTDEVVVDRQVLPGAMVTIETGGGAGVSDCAPSWERQDPRLSRTPRHNPYDAVLYPRGSRLAPTWQYLNAKSAAPGTEGDALRHTLGTVNDDGNPGTIANPFDGNYDLGSDQTGATRYDDLVDVPNQPRAKFGNVGEIGRLLCVGPMPVDPTTVGWSVTDWLVTRSPYTAVPDTLLARPLDAKKVNFIDRRLTVPPDPVATPADDPLGAASGIFNSFTVWCPWKDGKDNNGDWNAATDDTDLNGGPTPGDSNVDEPGEEINVFGRVNVNANTPTAYAAMAGLPFVLYDYSPENIPSYYLPNTPPTDDFYIAVDDGTTNCIRRIRENLPDRRFDSRRHFFETVIKPAIPGGALAHNFGCDGMDNHIYASPRIEWGTIQCPRRTQTPPPPPIAPPYGPMFILPRDLSTPPDGGDLLVDDKSEIDQTVGALMNMIALDTELPEGLATLSSTGIGTYYITVQITDGRDVDGVDDTVPPDGIGVAQPDWKEGTVLAEKRIIALVDTTLPASDPRRIQIFNWSVKGRYDE